MSSLWLNLRLGGLFIQWDMNRWLPRFSRIPGRPAIDERWAELYELRFPL